MFDKFSKKLVASLMAAGMVFAFAACGGESTEETADESAAATSLPTEIAQADWVDAKQYVELSTGINMAYVEMGNLDGEDLILVHGMTDSSRTWSEFVTYLTATDAYHIYIIDNMGHGDSDKPDTRNYDLYDHAANLAAFMDAMGLEKAALVGHSMGSGTVQAFSINYPERIEKMALFGVKYCEAVDRSTYDMTMDPSFDPSDEEFLLMWDGNPNPVNEELLDYVMEETGNIPVESWRAIAKGVSNSDLSLYLPDIAMDYLLLWGNLDGPMEEQYRVMDATAATETFVVYENVGHNIQWEQPEKLANDIHSYFQTGAPVSEVTE